MKKIFFLILFGAITAFSYAQGNLDSLFENDTNLTQAISDYNASMANLDQMLTLKTELEAQKLLKTYFLIGFIFMTIVVFILLFIYNAKIKSVLKNIEKHEDDLIIKNFHIEKLSLILNNIFDTVALIDNTGKLLWANSNFFKIRNCILINSYSNLFL